MNLRASRICASRRKSKSRRTICASPWSAPPFFPLCFLPFLSFIACSFRLRLLFVQDSGPVLLLQVPDASSRTSLLASLPRQASCRDASSALPHLQPFYSDTRSPGRPWYILVPDTRA